MASRNLATRGPGGSLMRCHRICRSVLATKTTEEIGAETLVATGISDANYCRGDRNRVGARTCSAGNTAATCTGCLLVKAAMKEGKLEEIAARLLAASEGKAEKRPRRRNVASQPKTGLGGMPPCEASSFPTNRSRPLSATMSFANGGSQARSSSSRFSLLFAHDFSEHRYTPFRIIR